MSYDPLMQSSGDSLSKAFRHERWRAKVEQILARLTGRSTDLLCYWEAYDSLMPKANYKIGRQEIPLAHIVGSVDRCTEFTRRFLPLRDRSQQRWTHIKSAFSSAKPLPPIQVYQVGEVYFVADGNHRVSVAQQQGMTHIYANIVQTRTRVPLSATDGPAEVLLKGEYVRFLERTRLDEIRPQAELGLTESGRYRAFEVQIEACRCFLALDQKRESTPNQAVGHWYDKVYLPVVQEIRERDFLPDFPGWTEADLYLALCEHRTALETAIGRQVELELAAADLARHSYARAPGALAIVGRNLRDTLRRFQA
jgi:hypothetical protein